MAIQGAPRRLRGQNPNAQQMPAFSPNDFGGQLGNMQIGNMGGLMGSQPLANAGMGMRMAGAQPLAINHTNKQVQGEMGGQELFDYALNNRPADYQAPVINNQVQGNMGGGLRRGGPAPPIPITDANREDMARLQKEQEQRDLNNMGGTMAERHGWLGMGHMVQKELNNTGGGYMGVQGGFDDFGNIRGGGGYIGVQAGFGGIDDFGNYIERGSPARANTNTSFNDTGFYGPTPQGGWLAEQGGNSNMGLPMNNGVNNMANPYTTDVLTGPAASTSGPSDTMAYGGALLGGLLGNDLSGALQAAGGYYAGQQGIEGAMATGQAGLGLGESMGKRAYDQSQFRPFGVTSNLANVQTTAEGGVNLNLSPEQQAMQQQLLGQSQGLFGQVGADPAAAQSALYEQIRATQQPEEERQRLQMQENLFSSGRGGVQTAMYGGTPEQMAYEKARQESMLNANLAARTQSQAEQLQAGQLGGMLQQAGYDPQRQAIDLFGASGVPSQLAAKGQLGGAELQAQAGGRGLESYMQGANMANLLQQQQLQGLMTGAVGKPLTAQEQLMNAMIGKLGGTPIEGGGGMLGGILDWGSKILGFGESESGGTPSSGGGYDGFGNASAEQINAAYLNNANVTPAEIAARYP